MDPRDEDVRQAVRTGAAIEYPESDGEPMGETDTHVEVMLDLLPLLKDHFRGRDDVYVAGDNFIYYREGDPRTVVSPDLYVVFGVKPGLRRTFKVWEEDGHTPAFVLHAYQRAVQRHAANE